MKKKVYSKIELACIFQQAEDIDLTKCHNGIISRQGKNKFRFEETIHKGRPPRNPKLYDGKYISMIRMKNGKYQFYMKALSDDFDRDKLPFNIYNEIVKALQILD